VAIHARQADVQDGDLRQGGPLRFQRRPPVMRLAEILSKYPQEHRQALGRVDVFIDDKDAKLGSENYVTNLPDARQRTV
jgi:hypothetical protein